MFSGIHHRLTLWYSGIFGLVLVLFSLSAYSFVRQALYQGIDEGSRQIAEGIRHTVAVDDRRLRVRQADFFHEGEEAGLFADAVLILVRDHDGKSVIQRGRTLPLPPALGAGNRTALCAGQAMRLHVSPIVEDGRQVGSIVLVRPLHGIHLALHRFGIALMGMSLLALLLAFWAGRFLAMQAMKPIQTSFERLHRFTTDASHELRTPLSVIQTQTEVLSARLPRTPQELSEALAPILHASRRMSVMIGDLLFLARSDAATLELRPVRLDLDELTEQVVEEQALLAEAKGLKVEFSGGPTPVRGDPERLYQVVSNLLDNAIKYTEAGTVRVAVEADAEAGKARLIIQDTGCGIAPEHLPFLFERFYRTQPAREARKPGSGLGLSIVQAVVRAHQGEIKVRSDLGGGTQAVVELPLAR